MSEVEVRYRGLALAKGMNLQGVGPSTAFIPIPEPPPVGTWLELATSEGLLISVSVLRVHEKVGKGDGAVGIRVRAKGLSGDSQAWWRTQVSGVDPTIPEPASIAGEPVDKARQTEVMSTAAIEAAVAEMEAERNRAAGVDGASAVPERQADNDDTAPVDVDGRQEDSDGGGTGGKKGRPRGKRRRSR